MYAVKYRGRGFAHLYAPPLCTVRPSRNYRLFFPAMPAQDPYLKLWCLVKGDQHAFSVTVPIAARVAQLKELIHRKKEKGSFRQLDVNPSERELFKVWYLQACATLRPSPSLYLRSIWPSSLNETSFPPSVSAPKIKTLLSSPIRGTPYQTFG